MPLSNRSVGWKCCQYRTEVGYFSAWLMEMRFKKSQTVMSRFAALKWKLVENKDVALMWISDSAAAGQE